MITYFVIIPYLFFFLVVLWLLLHCIVCGAPFTTTSPNKKRCDPCRKIAVKKQQQKAIKRLREKRRKAREASQ
jgi:hypothetical protein